MIYKQCFHFDYHKCFVLWPEHFSTKLFLAVLAECVSLFNLVLFKQSHKKMLKTTRRHNVCRWLLRSKNAASERQRLKPHILVLRRIFICARTQICFPMMHLPPDVRFTFILSVSEERITGFAPGCSKTRECEIWQDTHTHTHTHTHLDRAALNFHWTLGSVCSCHTYKETEKLFLNQVWWNDVSGLQSGFKCFQADLTAHRGSAPKWLQGRHPPP